MTIYIEVKIISVVSQNIFILFQPFLVCRAGEKLCCCSMIIVTTNLTFLGLIRSSHGGVAFMLRAVKLP